MATIGESISRIRNSMKAVKEEVFITDRIIYSLLSKYSKALIERDNKINNIFKNSSLFKELPYVELIDVDSVDNCFSNFSTGCKIKRSRNKLPEFSKVKGTIAIKYVATLDKSIRLLEINPSRYSTIQSSSSYKYNKSKYYWISNGYIYVPDVQWDAICMSAIFDGDVSDWQCDTEGKENYCETRQENEFLIPEHLIAECEQMTLSELLMLFKIPVDTSTDKQNLIR